MRNLTIKKAITIDRNATSTVVSAPLEAAVAAQQAYRPVIAQDNPLQESIVGMTDHANELAHILSKENKIKRKPISIGFIIDIQRGDYCESRTSALSKNQ